MKACYQHLVLSSYNIMSCMTPNAITFSASKHCQATKGTQDRLAMDRCRLEMAHFKYAVLNVCSWYPVLSTCDVVIKPGEQDEAVLHFTDKYYQCYSTKYAGKRMCVFDDTYVFMTIAVLCDFQFY